MCGVTKSVDTTRDDDPAIFPTSHTRGDHVAKEHNGRARPLQRPPEGNDRIVGHLVREGTRWRYELPETFGSLDEALDRVNELRL
jgi:hypothetical protein